MGCDLIVKDVAQALRAAERVEAGSVWINNIHRSYNEAPFGGFKESGLGREKSHYGLDEYLELKTIYLSLMSFDCKQNLVKPGRLEGW